MRIFPSSLKTVTSEETQYPDLYAPFIWASFLIAIFGGFGLAGHLSFVMSFGMESSNALALAALIQAHGHLQLFGWIGMLLLGVSLYVVPRLTSNQAGCAAVIPWIFYAALSGLLLRVIAPVIAVYASSDWLSTLAYCAAVGALFQLVAIGLYFHFLTSGLRWSSIDKSDFSRLLPFFLPMLLGWALFVIGDLLLTAGPALGATFEYAYWWASLHKEAFIRLVIVPSILGFGIKMIPIFLGLRPPLWPVQRIGWLLSISTILYLSCRVLSSGYPEAAWCTVIAHVSLVGVSAALLWYIWELDALLFRVKPERVSLKVFRADASSQRGRFGDRGEYGRFELFIIAGFGWLALGALVEAVNAVTALVNQPPLASSIIMRHIYVLGFASHLVFGVGHRLLPNLLKRRLFSPPLTFVSFLLLAFASLFRVIPVALSEHQIEAPKLLFGISGSLGALATIVFAWNLWSGTKKG